MERQQEATKKQSGCRELGTKERSNKNYDEAVGGKVFEAAGGRKEEVKGSRYSVRMESKKEEVTLKQGRPG